MRNPSRLTRSISNRAGQLKKLLPKEVDRVPELTPADQISPSDALLLYPVNQLANLGNELLDRLTGQDTELLATPPGAISPLDCDAYPDSPFCGNPFTRTPLGIDYEVIETECEICIRVTPIIGFTRLPPLTYCRRLSNCDPSAPPSVPELPPPPTGGHYDDPEEPPSNAPAFCPMYLKEHYLQRGTLYQWNSYDDYVKNRPPSTQDWVAGEHTSDWVLYRNNATIHGGGWQSNPGYNPVTHYYNYFSQWVYSWRKFPDNTWGQRAPIYTSVSYEFFTEDSSYKPPGFVEEPGKVYRYKFTTTLQQDFKYGPACQPVLPPSQPMIRDNCCKDTLDELRKIKKLIGNPNRKVPARLIMPGCPENDLVELKSLADNHEFAIRQMDRAVGWLPIEVEIEDTNTMQEGNQPLKMRIESFGDAFQQLLEILLESATDINTIQNVGVRTLWEAGLTHKLAAENQLEIQEIIEFLGFKVKDAVEEIPFCFNPTPDGLKEMLETENASEQELERMLPKLLQESMQKIRYTQNDDKKTLVSYILDILKETAIAASTRSTKVKDEAGLTKYMDGLNALMNIGQLMMLRSIRKALYGKKPEDFEKELNELERRYTKGAPVPPAPNDNDAPYQEELATDEKFKINLMTNFHGRFANPSEYTTTTWQDEETTQD